MRSRQACDRGRVDGVRRPQGRGATTARRQPPAGTPRAPVSVGLTQALPRIRFILVPQTGQMPCAMRRPDSLTLTSP